MGTGNRDRPADLPIVVELVDTEEKIAGILPVFDEMVGDGMMTLETVRIVTYRTVGFASAGSAFGQRISQVEAATERGLGPGG